MRYFTLAIMYVGGLAGTIYLIERNQPYWAGVILFFTVLVFGADIREIDKNMPRRSTSIPLIALIFVSSLAAFMYLIRQNSPYWAGGILFLGLLAVSLGLSEVRTKKKLAFYPGGIVTAVSGLAASIYLFSQRYPDWTLGSITLPDWRWWVVILVTLLCAASSKFLPDSKTIPTTCEYCIHYRAGHVDRQSNYMLCQAKHRLLSEGDLRGGTWFDRSEGSGEVMFGRTDFQIGKVEDPGFMFPLILGGGSTH